MPQFKFKNLPKGFEFALTKQEIREFIKTTQANFEVIEFGGISSSESYMNKSRRHNMNWVSYLKAEFRESQWFFRLEVNGLRPEHYQERREEIAQAILTQIKKWVDEKLALPETAPKKPCRAHIYFNLTKKPKDIVKLSEWS
ncbi:MAG TPA: hypothetical protein VGB77_17550 [Abditibacteriaceae bacterium]|jgi:hypothetical protein